MLFTIVKEWLDAICGAQDDSMSAKRTREIVLGFGRLWMSCGLNGVIHSDQGSTSAATDRACLLCKYDHNFLRPFNNFVTAIYTFAMSLKQCCATGSLHTGTPTGRLDRLHGLDCYVADAPNNARPKGIIIIIPDAFGWTLPNNRILADDYAKHGFQVYLPEFMQGKRDIPLLGSG